MKTISYIKLIKDRIDDFKEPFILADFYDLANHNNVRKIISRLELSGYINRIYRGIYYKPEFNDFINEFIKPSPTGIAKAIARNYGWKIIPCGDTALNYLGLSTQIPATWTYASSGNYKSFEIENTKISFKHITYKEITNLSEKTAMLIQAIKAYGKDNIDENFTNKIKIIFNRKDIDIFKSESRYTFSWIHNYINEL